MDHLQGLFYNLFFIQMKNTKKSLISTLEEIKANLSYDTDSDLSEIYNACIDYMNETQDWSIEEVFEEYLSSDIAEDYLKHELDNWWIFRLYYAMWECRGNCDRYRLNVYWNLEEIEESDLENTIDEIISRLAD